MKQLVNKNRYDFLKEFNQGGICAELGVYKGSFSRSIFDWLKPKKLHLVDMWWLSGKKWGWSGESTFDAFFKVVREFEDELVNGQVEIDARFDDKFLLMMPDDYFDWVYLDTAHSYYQTSIELPILKDKVKDNGIIAGHDWRPNVDHKHHGVFKAINEFIEKNDYEIILLDNHSQWAIKKKVIEK